MSNSGLYDQALRALIQRNHTEAEQAITAMLARDGNDASAWFLKGRLAAERGDFSQELELTQRAVALKPDSAEYIAQLGKCYGRVQDMPRAIACAEQAEAGAGLSDLTLDAIAAIYTRFGLHERAAAVLKRAIADGTRNPAIHFNLGASLKFCGDFAGARLAFERAIELAPQYHKAHAALTSLGRITAEANHLDRLTALMAETPDPRTRIHLCHAAAKEYETLDDYAAAFRCLDDGKRALRTTLDYDFAHDKALFDAVRAGFDARPAATEGAPIFVLGMPRSGTTVVDRILSNHSTVASIGESRHFDQLLKRACGSDTRHLIDDRVIAQAGEIDLAATGDAYVAHGHALAGAKPRFLDKFHLNIWLAGYIASALPQARLVCLVRDPLDTIVSNYRQLFEFTTPLYRYALDLADAARFYVEFRRLAGFWAERFPEQFRLVCYEDVVANPEAETRALLDVCNLSWEPQCARIETNTSAVATASAVQVRQPINRNSVGAWRHYEPYLDEAKAILAKAGF